MPITMSRVKNRQEPVLPASRVITGQGPLIFSEDINAFSIVFGPNLFGIFGLEKLLFE